MDSGKEKSLNSPLVLVVDDDTRLRKLLQKFLSENGFRVFTAADTREAGAIDRKSVGRERVC